MTVFNKEVVDFTKQPMFFGEPLNTARFDKMKFKKFDDLSEQQLGFFWRPSEVDISQDANDFNNKMTPVEQRIFTANLQYQTLLDSIQGRSPLQCFLPICSLPELENWIETWAFSETIHSRSYTYILKNVYNDPSKVLDNIMVTPEIIERARMVTAYYDNLERLIKDPPHFQYELCEALFDCMVSTYALEAIRFYVSFACSYSFAERGLMEGNAKIILLVNRDEWGHAGGTHFILTRWLKGLDDPMMTEVAKQRIESGGIIKIFKEVYDQECAWAEYLFSEGDIPMLNAEVLKQYLGWLTDKCLLALSIEDTNFGPKSNPIPWVEAYTESGSRQVAPQEAELGSYMVGAVDMNDDISDFEYDL